MKVWFSNQLNACLGWKLARRWRARPRPTFHPEKLQRVLLVELGGLGDAVNVLPVMGAIQARMPAAQFSVICRDYVEDLFEMLPEKAVAEGAMPDGPAKVLGISKSMDGIGRASDELGTMEWDLIVSTCWSAWATALALRLKAKALSGFWRPWRVESFGFEPMMTTVIRRGDHLMRLRFKAVSALGIEVPVGLPVPCVTPRASDEESVQAKHPGLGGGHCVFIPFCQDSGKSLTFDESLLAFRMLQECGGRVVLVGGKAEAPLLQRLAQNLSRKGVPDETQMVMEAGDGKPPPVLTNLSVPELVAVLSKAQLVMSVDTGAMHLATAVRIPTVGIFKATDPKQCGPVGHPVLTVRLSEMTPAELKSKVVSWRGSTPMA